MSERDYYPAMSESQWRNAPFNEYTTPEKEFDMTCSQSLSRTATVYTSDYIPGASGVDYEPDGEGGFSACGWHDADDTSETHWSEVYKDNDCLTPLELIGMLKEYLQKDLEKWKAEDEKTPNAGPAFHVRRLKHLIDECECWTEDETEFCEG